MNAKKIKQNATVAMVQPRTIDAQAYIDDNDGIYVGVRVTRALHGRLMAEKSARGGCTTLGELVAEALVIQFSSNNN